MRMKSGRRAMLTGTIMAALLAAGGCVTAQRGLGGVDNEGKRHFLTYAAGSSPVLLTVVGSPFREGDAATAETAAKAATGAVFGSSAAFTAKPAEAAHANHRIVLMFDPAPTAMADRLCGATPPAKAAPTAGRLAVMAAFCAGDKLISSADASGPAVAGPGEEGFRQIVRAAVRELFPVERDRDRDSDPDFPEPG